MERMYLAKFFVMYLSDSLEPDVDEASVFIKDEVKCNGASKGLIECSEITEIDQIPKGWTRSANLWGTDNDVTPVEFLKQRLLQGTVKDSPEYQEYLRLRKKYGKYDE